MNNMDLNLIMEMIVEEGYRRYEERPEIDRDLVRSLYSVWLDIDEEFSKLLRDSRPNVKGG